MRISDWSSDVCSSDLRPVFVLHHGNPRWALISIPLLSNLADEADHDAGDARLAALHDITLDHMRNMMIVLDSDLVITGINAAARAYLRVSPRDAAGRPPEPIKPAARRVLPAAAAARAPAPGVG